MPKYEDCLSCAFYQVEPAICDECDEADQWEPDDVLNAEGRVLRTKHRDAAERMNRIHLLKKAA